MRTAVYTKEEIKLEEKNRKKSAVITAAIFLALLVVFFIVGFRTPLPLPAEQGIEVALGAESMGDLPEPTNSPAPAQPAEPVEEVTPENTPEPTPEVSEPVEEQVVTQDVEEAPAVNTKPKPTPQPKPKPEVVEQPKPAEQPKKEEEQPEKPKEPQRESNPMYEFPGSEKAGGSGNQPNKPGDPDGSETSDQTGNQGKSPTGGEGISFSLYGRSMMGQVKPEAQSQQPARVVVEIVVDPEGNVIRARAGVRGSTTSDPALLQAAKEAALRQKFSSRRDAGAEQVGTISYNFRPQ